MIIFKSTLKKPTEFEKNIAITKGFNQATNYEIAIIFSNSNNISYEKGRSYFSDGDFKKKRRYYEIEDKIKDGQDNYKLEELKLKIK